MTSAPTRRRHQDSNTFYILIPRDLLCGRASNGDVFRALRAPPSGEQGAVAGCPAAHAFMHHVSDRVLHRRALFLGMRTHHNVNISTMCTKYEIELLRPKGLGRLFLVLSGMGSWSRIAINHKSNAANLAREQNLAARNAKEIIAGSTRDDGMAAIISPTDNLWRNCKGIPGNGVSCQQGYLVPALDGGGGLRQIRDGS
ncbi:hypothetical protein FIBSPDRAFT_898255 [Athelia psychrophila]|uniref:Uncharacterized protein n=1 Tax=Athelia psychrophila TaxID=1759441 RepID=A0A166B8N4_9AGAM|nr:hypothetical protein FIBSPDRAFT_898255 [Fibularhizoctonia sp. CBS 109695]